MQLARLMLARPNLLLLDEPTNNLDIPSAEVLEAALDEFDRGGYSDWQMANS